MDWSDLDLELLRGLGVLVAEGRFTKAARVLGIEQTTLSKRVQRLEQSIGMSVVVRSHAGVALTPAGEALLQGYHELTGVLSNVVARLTELQAESTVRIGAIETVAVYTLPKLLRAMREETSTSCVSQLVKGFSDNLEQEVSEGHLDLAIITGPVRSQGLVRKTLARERCLVAVNASHTWTRAKRCVTVQQLAEEALIIAPSCRGATLLETLCKSRGIELNIAFRTHDAVSLVALVEAGCGVAVVPESCARNETQRNVRFLPLEDNLEREIVLVHRGVSSLTRPANVVRQYIQRFWAA